MAAGATSLVAVLRDARKRRAPLDEADEWCRYDSNLGNAVLVFLDAKRRYHPLTPPEWFEEMGRTLALLARARAILNTYSPLKHS
jgi:hypothetical protein